MPEIVEGQLIATGLRFGVVGGARFNTFITGRLLEGALDACSRHGRNRTQWTWYGCRERSRYRSWLNGWPTRGSLSAVVCLGCLIRGGTPHFDYLAGEVTKGVAERSEPVSRSQSSACSPRKRLSRPSERAGKRPATRASSRRNRDRDGRRDAEAGAVMGERLHVSGNGG